MSYNYKKSLYIPGLKNNTILQLIMFIGVMYMMLGVSWAIIKIIFIGDETLFRQYFIPFISLGSLEQFKSHFWTIFTYQWFQEPQTFFLLLSNMVWLYTFGAVVQSLIGPKHIFPMYIYATVLAGVVYTLLLFIPGKYAGPGMAVMGSMAGIICMAIAAITLSSDYRYFLSETLSIPIMVPVGIYVFLALLYSGFTIFGLTFVFVGAFVGWGYVKLIQSGYKPGRWMYAIVEGLEASVTPKNENKARKIPLTPNIKSTTAAQKSKQQVIDDILDKINVKGYDSLSEAEKNILKKESQK